MNTKLHFFLKDKYRRKNYIWDRREKEREREREKEFEGKSQNFTATIAMRFIWQNKKQILHMFTSHNNCFQRNVCLTRN